MSSSAAPTKRRRFWPGALAGLSLLLVAAGLLWWSRPSPAPPGDAALAPVPAGSRPIAPGAAVAPAPADHPPAISPPSPRGLAAIPPGWPAGGEALSPEPPDGLPPAPAAPGGDPRSPVAAAAPEHVPDDAREDDGTVPRTVHPPDREGIRAAVREASPAIKECYEAWLRAEPRLQGRVQVELRIESTGGEEPTGRVAGARLVHSALGHLALDGCILNTFEGLLFSDPGPAPITVRYPLQFSQGPAAPSR